MAYTRPVAVTASGTTGIKTVFGWSFTENGGGAGAAARVLLRDGSVTGTIFEDIRLLPQQSVGNDYPTPINCPSGNLYVEVTTGTVRGSVRGG